MARARNIKPAFFKNDELSALAPLARLLFIGLWTIVDREGRIEDRPRIIKAEVLPFDDCDADALLSHLYAAGFIRRYEVNGTRFLDIPKFVKHQRPHPDEKKSTVPAFSLAYATATVVRSPSDTPTQANAPIDIVHTPTKSREISRGSREKVSASCASSLNHECCSLNPSSLNAESSYCSEPEKPAAEPQEPMVLTFPVQKTGEHWGLTSAKLAEYQESFPHLDVLAVLRAARQWCIDNPNRRKTRNGMPRFLGTWLSNEQNRGRAGPAAAKKPSPASGSEAWLAMRGEDQ